MNAWLALAVTCAIYSAVNTEDPDNSTAGTATAEWTAPTANSSATLQSGGDAENTEWVTTTADPSEDDIKDGQGAFGNSNADNSVPKNAITDVFNLSQWLDKPEVFGHTMVGVITIDEDVFHVVEGVLYETQYKKNSLYIGKETEFVGRHLFRKVPSVYRDTSPGALFQFALNMTELELIECKKKAIAKNMSLWYSSSVDGKAEQMLQHFRPYAVINPVLHAFTLGQNPPIGVNDACYSDMQHVLHSAYDGQMWAIEIFDSWGKIPVGVLNGNINWIGMFDQCNAIVVPASKDSSVWSTTDGFKGSYCDINIELPETLGIPAAPGHAPSLPYGACFPSTCNSKDVKLIMQSLTVFGMKLPPILRSRCHIEAPLPNGELPYDSLALSALALFGIFAILLVFCTCIDGILLRDDSHKEDESNPNVGQVNEGMEMEMQSKEKEGLASLDGTPADETKDYEVIEPYENLQKGTVPSAGGPEGKTCAVLTKLVKAFSLYTNLPLLLSTEVRPGTLIGLDAIRYLSMCWIILGHCYTLGAAFMPGSLSNLKGAIAVLKDFTFQAIYSAPLGVDSFFCLSGTLVTYLFFKDLKKSNGKLGWEKMVLFYVHRFCRILPLYMMVVFALAALSKYLGAGPIFDWQNDRVFDCYYNWWTNLLFVNNFVNPKEMCLSWSWYLSNDMQFYWISPIILIPLYFTPLFGIAVLGAAFAIHFSVTGYLWSLSDGRNYLNDVDIYYDAYIKPYCRIGPYLVGMILGGVLYKKYKVRQQLYVWAAWFIALALIISVTFVQYEETQHGELINTWNRAQRTLYETFGRTAFALGLAWIIYAVNNGHAGPIGDVLKWGGWAPLGRLTFGAFLLHPVLIMVYVGNRRDLFYVNYFSQVWMFSAYMVLAYGASALLSLMIEMPMAGLEKLAMPNKR